MLRIFIYFSFSSKKTLIYNYICICSCKHECGQQRRDGALTFSRYVVVCVLSCRVVVNVQQQRACVTSSCNVAVLCLYFMYIIYSYRFVLSTRTNCRCVDIFFIIVIKCNNKQFWQTVHSYQIQLTSIPNGRIDFRKVNKVIRTPRIFSRKRIVAENTYIYLNVINIVLACCKGKSQTIL